MIKFNVFKTGNPKISNSWLDNVMYALALDSFTKVCCDVLFTHHGKYFIAERKTLPHNDYWIVGGRCIHGLDVFENMQRIISRETGLHITRDRLDIIACVNYIWDTREQPPQENGTSDVACIFVCELTDYEYKNIWLDKTEYISGEWRCQMPEIKQLQFILGAYHTHVQLKDLRIAKQNGDNAKMIEIINGINF